MGRVARLLIAAGSHVTMRQWFTCAGVVGFVFCARWGLGRLESHVARLPVCNPRPRLVLEELPDWAIDENWAPRFCSAVSLDETGAWLDGGWTARIAEKFRRSGWVKNVRWVRRYEDGTVRVACEFRRPIAMVKTSRGYIPVDSECYRLPEEYERLSRDDKTPSAWITIVGVKSPPPPVGERWAGADVRAGVDLASRLFDRSLGARTREIDVSNHSGADPHRKRTELAMHDGMSVRWGSPPGEEIEEPSLERKLRNAEWYIRQQPWRPWIDVSVYDDKVIVPRGGGGGTQTLDVSVAIR